MANYPPSSAVRLADELVLAAVRLTRRLRAQDDQARLSGPSASALAVVVHAGRIMPSELARLEEVRRPTIARTLAALESAGLVRREPDAADGRRVWIAATEAGLRMIAEGQARRTAPLARQIASLPAADRAALERALPILDRLARGATSTA